MSDEDHRETLARAIIAVDLNPEEATSSESENSRPWRIALSQADAVLAAQVASGGVEWGTAVSDEPETIVRSKSEERARRDVDGWNSERAVVRGERPRGILYKRTVGPWVEVTK